MLHDLRTALEVRDLFVVYQPQINLANNAVVGIEALLRWRNPKGELVPLDQFISVAEQSGLIVEVGAWVLNTALVAQGELGAVSYTHLDVYKRQIWPCPTITASSTAAKPSSVW